MMSNDNNYYGYAPESSSRSLTSFIQRVYVWMMSGLVITALTAHSLYVNQTIFLTLFSSKWVFIGLVFAQLALVGSLAIFIQKLSYAASVGIYLLYSALVGITMAPIFFVYKEQSICLVFAITAGMFATMAIYGYFTNTDLSKMGSLLLMALFGIIIASLVNLYFQSAGFDLIISYIGVLIFTGLIAYDMQKIKHIFQNGLGRDGSENKIAIVCALTLYLDFINLFVFLLRILGQRRRD